MNLKAIKQITIDFHDKKYISVNAKQFDTSSRFILVTCNNNGDFFYLNKETDAAYVRYKKANDLGVFNRNKVTDDGKVLVELTEQMLAAVGVCQIDLVIIRKNSENNRLDDLFDFTSSYDGKGVVTLHQSDFIKIEDDNEGVLTVEIRDLGEIITSGKYSILSTMTFYVNVSETALDNVEMEDTYEFNALNDALIKSLEDYDSVMTACKISEEASRLSEYMANMYEENAKNYSLNAKISETNATLSESNAKTSENNAKTSETNAKASETNAKTFELNASASESNAKKSEENAKLSEENAKISENNSKESENNSSASEMRSATYAINAKASEENALISETNAKTSEDNAKISENNAKVSETNSEVFSTTAESKAVEASTYANTSFENAQTSINCATESLNSATLSKSYAVGETNTRTNEDVDNSKYYYTKAKAVSDSLDGSFLPMGTIEFLQLQTAIKDTGYVYHISDSFVTDDTFKSGAGISYPAGTNVYYTSDGYWDCFTGRFVTIEEYESLIQMVSNLLKRIEVLEEYNVLEITE